MPKKSIREEGTQEAERRSGFRLLAGWSGYTEFRSRAIVFLVAYNVYLLITNASLAFGYSFGPMLGVIGVLAGALAVYAAIQFTETARNHFEGQAQVRKTIDRAAERVGEPETWVSFSRTLDGRLTILVIVQGIVMAVQLWNRLH